MTEQQRHEEIEMKIYTGNVLNCRIKSIAPFERIDGS